MATYYYYVTVSVKTVNSWTIKLLNRQKLKPFLQVKIFTTKKEPLEILAKVQNVLPSITVTNKSFTYNIYHY